ncbi:ATP-binding protein [Dictyobacter kobayashii]|uniref:Circadian input-output histidine kinase CikA n=1 Tax=Dictyobacter kobayashii TaxID=2014872 RepID=A0A402AUI3_9CHLR|nr:ATP-binding protein [Dictyobacter kobayashii]GCE22796.1 hypothetical protein KDK_65960 [Dictyobacter kobayashii]
MINNSQLQPRKDAQRSLIAQLRKRLFISVAFLVLCLLLSSVASFYVSSNQQQLGEQKVALHDNINGLLQAMIDQETGLRGYIATNNSSFLQPFTSGQQNYTSYLQKLKTAISSDSFHNTALALDRVEGRVITWTNNYANPQLVNMRKGDLKTARSDNLNSRGKGYFDALRADVAFMQSTSDSDLAVLQNGVNIRGWSFLGSLIALTLIVIVYLWYTFRLYVAVQREQLDNLKSATTAFGAGDLTARVKEGRDSELNEVGLTFNNMAEVLQEQQGILKDRDILEQVMQLNTLLTESLDLSLLMQHFFQRLLSLLDVQIAALYLYDDKHKQLELSSSRGLQFAGRQTIFALGEGLVGQVAQDREPLLVTRQSPATEAFSIKTVIGEVLPSTLYHLPLIQGNELMGVLVVGSVFSMSERTRNVIQVVASNVATAVRNTQTYEHTQQQARELAEYSHQQELSNQALRQQRDELTVLNSALEEANRVRSQFLSTMSHELRTPLASIIGFSQIIMRSEQKSPLSGRQHDNVERILKNAQHLLSLINDVLDLAKIEAGRMDIKASEIDVQELLNSVVEETRSIALERKLRLSTSVQEGITTIETDPRKVRQILLNLVSNALKFTEKGSVTVSAVRQSVPNGRDDGVEQIAISVVDTGIGISSDKQEHIFEAFYQVDNSNSRSYGGTGLGLSIVRELTLLLGGKVEIQSEEGKGSTFTIVLPIHLRDQRFIHEMRLNTLQDQKNITTILPNEELPLIADTATLRAVHNVEPLDKDAYLVVAVDDNPDVLQLIAASLEQTPYRVVGVQDSSKAIEIIQELRPKVITLDIMMPRVNGWQILHQLKSNPATVSIPVILLTVLEDRSAGYVLGADEYLVKPVARDALLNVLQQLTTREPVAVHDLSDSPFEPQSLEGSALIGDTVTPSASGNSLRKPILLVHNEPNIHLLIDKLKDKTGYVLQRASEGQDLMNVIEKVRPDLLMMLIHADDGNLLGERIKSVVEQSPPPYSVNEDSEGTRSS